MLAIDLNGDGVVALADGTLAGDGEVGPVSVDCANRAIREARTASRSMTGVGSLATVSCVTVAGRLIVFMPGLEALTTCPERLRNLAMRANLSAPQKKKHAHQKHRSTCLPLSLSRESRIPRATSFSLAYTTTLPFSSTSWNKSGPCFGSILTRVPVRLGSW